MRLARFACGLLAAGLVPSLVGQDLPTVTMLVPGFTVRELPVQLTNINNLRFTPDGKLSALGYDGRVHLLADTDGDGVEDTATLYWEHTTLRVPVGMAWSSQGLYVSSQGKVSLLRDTDGDGKADTEDVIASGWPKTDVASGGVDATAVTLDREGNLYFGLLTANYANPYRVKDGVSRYDLSSPRGTIQKMAAATRQLETVATGIRVPYTLAFNRHNDLFVTDQEGATWCPDGNPLDELNHIIPGRNYGFPPRHDTYLPNLISEPPVVGFGPQHQSACGFLFNETSAGRRRFGPVGWEGDAIVAGQSRGKLWRARLVKTDKGYVGQETTIARLSLLTMDVAVSPAGDLYVACHTGTPDWGTGPKGKGRLFKISHSDAAAPQPVALWAASQLEVRVAFDRPVDPSITNDVERMQIEFGDYVSAADRFEALKPPYKVVKAQAGIPRGKLRVAAARLSPDGRTLSLTTDPHPQSVQYALSVPGVKAAAAATAPATVDLAYNLGGVEAKWTATMPVGRADSDTTASWQGWLPHLSTEVAAAFTAESAEHQLLAERMRRPGRLRLRTQVALPGTDPVLRLTSTTPFEGTVGTKAFTARSAVNAIFTADVALGVAGQTELLTLELETQTAAASSPSGIFSATYSSKSDPTVRPVPLAALLLPWTRPHVTPPLLENEKTDLTGGDYERGRALFFGKQILCATCHHLRGEGGTLGPDLSNLVHRDAASVLRDIKEPSAMINPDYVAYTVSLRGGGEVAGYVRTQDDGDLRIIGPDGKEQAVARAAVADLRPSPVSLMPPGLMEGLTETQVRDLLTFLVHAPPVRTAAEVAVVRRASASAAATAKPRPLTIVLVASKQDHGKGQHDYPAWQKMWQGLLGRAAGVTVTEAWEWPAPEQWRTADAIVFNFRNRNWSPERLAELDAFQARGGGIVAFHAATIIDQEPERLAERLGLSAQPGPTKYLHTPMTLKFASGSDHGITRGLKNLSLLDEPYWPMFGDPKRIRILATADVAGQPRPMVWTFEPGRGRVFGSIPGHYTWTFEDPLFRILALRGVAWVCGEPESRFDFIE